MKSIKRKLIIPISTLALLSSIAIPASASEKETTIQSPSNQEKEDKHSTTIYENGYVAKTVNVKGVSVTIVGKEADMEEDSPYYKEQLELAKATMDLDKSSKVKDDGSVMVVPDQYSTYKISDYYYNDFLVGDTWDRVNLAITTAAGLLATGISTSLNNDGLTTGAISVGASAVASLVVMTTQPDYTKAYYIKSWSSYYNMYTYQLVTAIYDNPSRDWGLIGHKLSGPLKKVGSTFYGL